MSDIRNKLGVGFLTKRPSPRQQQQTSKDFLDEAVMLYGRMVLESLKDAPNGEENLFKIVETKNIPITDALQLAEYLQGQRLIEIVQQDKLGNHLLRITPLGSQTIN